MTPTIILSLCLACCLFIYRYVVHPLLISPLSKVPAAHWSAPFTPLYILSLRYRRRENRTLLRLHARLGPIIRLAPNELSVNTVHGGIRTIYSGGWEKHAWYTVFTNYGGVGNTFCSLGRDEHSARKRMTSGCYAKSAVHSSPVARAVAGEVVCRRLLGRLEGVVEVEAYELFSGAAMDFVTGYVFGPARGSGFLLDAGRCKAWVEDYKARQEFTFWPQELPRLTAWLETVGIRVVPRWVDVANKNIEEWVWGLCEGAERDFVGRAEESGETQAVVYNQLRANLKRAKGQKADAELTETERVEIASELLDHVAAGFDTTGITLTYLAWELSRSENALTQDKLRRELRTCQPTYRLIGSDEAFSELPDFKALDGLPMLHAVVMETLRLHAAIPGGQPRITPQNAELGVGEECIKGIPAGVRVNSAAYTLHLNEDVFPDAGTWRPERWLNERGEIDGSGEKARWFWAFGSGGRMCIGSNLAMTEMKAFVAAIWANFVTTIAEDAGMVHADGYTAEPMGTGNGDYLRLRIRHAAS